MLNFWNKLINTDCVVINISGQAVYPIFRNGSTSLLKAGNGKLTNKEISDCSLVTIFLRDPNERFVSGLNEYCRQNSCELLPTLQKVKKGKLVDRHFAPQWIWLLHLYKWYRGEIILKPVESIREICDVHTHRSPRNISVEVPKNFCEVDYKLLKSLNRKIELSYLINEYKNVLS